MHTAFSTRAPTHAMFPLAARDMVSLYVDGATAARNVAGAFFGVALRAGDRPHLEPFESLPEGSIARELPP